MQVIGDYTLRCLITVLYCKRSWHTDLQRRFHLHPIVHKLLSDHARPIDWHRVVLEWPHVSESDPTRLAYTRDERSGEQDRQVVTSINKYVRERWTHADLPDHVLREMVDAYNAKQSNTCEFVPDTTTDYIKVVQTGPRSCMRWDAYDEDDDDTVGREHPYRCYDPKYGWRMAVRRNGRNQIVGRALVLETDKDKCFVRTFKADGDDPNSTGYSHSDEKLQAWLKDRGYAHYDGWPRGTKLYTEASRGDYLAPYIDGDRYHADLVHTADGETHWRISGDGEYELRETNGVAGESSACTCEHCGSRVSEDDLHNTGVDSDYAVCTDCLESDFTYVDNVCRWGGAYINNDEVAQTVEGDNIVPSISRTCEDYVRLDNGCHADEWTHIDNTVCDINGEYWHEDDVGDDLLQLDGASKHAYEYADSDDVHTTMCGRHFHEDDLGETIIELEHGVHEGEYVLLDDTVTDSHGDRWHTDDIDKYIKQSALDEDVYVDIDQIEITEGETE